MFLIYFGILQYSSCQLDRIPAATTRTSAAAAQQPDWHVLHTDQSAEWKEGTNEYQEWAEVSFSSLFFVKIEVYLLLSCFLGTTISVF